MRESVLTGGAPVSIRLLRIALPLGMAAAVRYAVELSAIYWTGKLGVSAIAVVSSLAYALSLLRVIAGLTSAGTAAVVGRLIGEERRAHALGIVQQVVAVAPVLGAAIAVVAALASGVIVRASGLPAEVHADATRYLLVLVAGLPVAYGLLSLNAALVGLGHARTAFVVNAIALLVAFALTPLLVVFARLGLVGAALAQVSAEALAFAWGTVRLRAIVRDAGAVWLPFRARLRRASALAPVLRVGAPLTLDAVLHATVGFALVSYMARYGAEYVAAQGTEERLTQILNLPTEGLAPAAATLVGFHVGRGELAIARRAIVVALAMMTSFAVIGGVLLLLAPGPLVSLLCSDAGYVRVSVRVLAIAAVTLVFLGARDLMDSSFGGLGNTLPPLVVGTLVTVTRVPLAWVLSRATGLGGLGVTWAINGTLIAQGIVLLAWLFLRFDAYARSAAEADATSEPAAAVAEAS